jgi:hypothetical protein
LLKEHILTAAEIIKEARMNSTETAENGFQMQTRSQLF